MSRYDLTGISVMIAMPTHRDLHPLTVRSLLETQHALLTRGIPLDCEMEVGGSLVHHARCKAAHRFLQGDCNRLFWVDSDIAWDAADFIRLLALSTEMECVCAAYPAKQEPTVFFVNAEPGEVEANKHGCIPIKGAGLGFTVVQREVIEKLAEQAPLRKFPSVKEQIPRIFRCDEEGDSMRGEDMAFFADVRELGYTVNMDPSITLSHIGWKAYSGCIRDVLVKKGAPSPFESGEAPTRTAA